MSQNKHRLWHESYFQLTLAIGLFALAAFLSSRGTMPGWEVFIFKLIYGLPDSLRPLFFVLTQLGSIYFIFLLAIGYLLLRHNSLVIRLLMSGLLAYLLAGVGKDLLGRPRPIELIADVIHRDYMVRGPGFPSGHVALAAAAALSLWFYLPKSYKWLVPAWIIGVGLSRIYLGVHAPLDVVGGVAIGWGSALLFRNVRITDKRQNRRIYIDK